MFALGSRPAAQEIETNKATVEKAKAIPKIDGPAMSMALMPPPNKDAIFNRKQQRIGEHHRPTPIKPRPERAQATPPQSLEAATEMAIIREFASLKLDSVVDQLATLAGGTALFAGTEGGGRLAGRTSE